MPVKEFLDGYRRDREKLDLFDANCWIGIPPNPGFSVIKTFGQAKERLLRYGIRKAILSHFMSKEYDTVTGNNMLTEAIKECDGFLGAAVVIPGNPSVKEFRGYIQSLVSKKVRLVRLFPKSHNFLLSDWYAGESLSVLEELHIPVVFWHTEIDWDEVAKICSEHPALNVIIEGTGRKLFYHNKIYYRLFDKFSNFYMETHNLTNYLGLEDIVRRFGSEHLIFGTYFPCQDPNTSIMLITHGNLSARDKTNIAHRNLERLAEGVGER